MKLRWAPAIVLVLGSALTLGASRQRSMPLVRPLSEVVPVDLLGYRGQDVAISDAEIRVAGFSNYLHRVYEGTLATDSVPAGAAAPGDPEEPASAPTDPEAFDTLPPWFSIYVGYYPSQARGKTIHSPKNCLPGAGWEALSSEAVAIELADRTVLVNQYVLQNDLNRALTLYWYQGRGRIAHNEYRVKVNLLLDSALRRRSDEALVRIVVPVEEGNDEAARNTAVSVARQIIPGLDLALPAG